MNFLECQENLFEIELLKDRKLNNYFFYNEKLLKLVYSWTISTLNILTGAEGGPLLAKLCGMETPANLTTVTGNRLFVKFRSDVSISGDGFRAYYEHIYGGIITK